MGIMRMLGLGWTFQGKDEGLRDLLKKENDGLIGIAKSIRDINKEWINRTPFEKARSVLGFARSAAETTAGLFADIGRNLSSPLEAGFVAADMIGARVAAATGVAGKEFGHFGKQIGSMALKLNRDAGTIGDTFLNMARFVGRKGVSEIFGGMENVVKITDVFKVSSEDLGKTVSRLRGLFAFTNDEIRGVFDSVKATGDRFGATDVFLQSASKIVGSLSDSWAALQTRLSKPEVSKLIRSVTAFAGAQIKAGEDAGEAIQRSVGLMQFLGRERKELEGMMVGLKDLPNFTKELSLHFNSFGDAVRSIRNDPLKFADMMARLVRTMPPAAKQTARLSQVLDEINPGFLNVIKNSTAGVKALHELASAGDILGEKGSLAKAANSLFRVGRTMQESFELMKQAFDLKIRRLTAPMLQKWFGSMRTNFAQAGTQIKQWAGDQGPLGFLTRNLIHLDQVGIGGVLASIPGLGAGFLALGPGLEKALDLTFKLTPVMSLLGGAMNTVVRAGAGLLRWATSPFGLLLGALVGGIGAASGFKLESAPGIKTSLGFLTDGIVNAGKSIWGGLKSGFNLFLTGDFKGGLDKIVNGFKTAGSALWQGLKEALAPVTAFFSGVGAGIQRGTSKMSTPELVALTLNPSTLLTKLAPDISAGIREKMGELATHRAGAQAPAARWDPHGEAALRARLFELGKHPEKREEYLAVAQELREIKELLRMTVQSIGAPGTGIVVRGVPQSSTTPAQRAARTGMGNFIVPRPTR
jgi:hypothetical protein